MQCEPQLTSEILLKYFHAALKVSLFDEAYMALSRFTDEALYVVPFESCSTYLSN
jgi:hypothetical protein